MAKFASTSFIGLSTWSGRRTGYDVGVREDKGRSGLAVTPVDESDVLVWERKQQGRMFSVRLSS